MMTLPKLSPEGAISGQPLVQVEHNKAGLGDITVTRYALNDVELFDVKGCGGVDGAFYPLHAISLFKRPYVMDASWEGKKFQADWQRMGAVFLPKGSTLSFTASKAYDEIVVRLNDNLFVQAARDHVDLDQVEFTLRDISSSEVWRFGLALAGVVRNPEYVGWPLLVESAALALVLAIIRRLAPGSSTAFKTGKDGVSEVRVKRVLDYINDNMGTQITLAELAGVANLSVYHFSRRFKLRMGMTPMHYVADVRVGAAKRKLRATNDSLVAISMDCGFANQSHFSTAFKQITGVTPARYRHAAR